MKKYLILFILLKGTLCLNAQYYNDFYIKISKSYNEMTQITDYASVGGSYTSALRNLEEIDKKSFPYISNMALLKYNTIGKDSAYTFLENTSLGNKDKLFIKWWIADLTKNIEDEESLKSDFNATYRESIPMLKHIYMTKISDYYYLKDKSKTMLENIDLVTKNYVLDTSDIIFFELMRCQIYDRNDWRKCEIIDILSSLWERYPQYLDKKQILNLIEDCETQTCNSFRQNLIFAKTPVTIEPKIKDLITYINKYLDNDSEITDNPDSLAVFCASLENMLSKADSRLMREKMLGIIKLMTMTSYYSSTLQEISLDKLNYPLEFRQKLKSSSEKSDLYELFEEDLQIMSKILPEINEILDQEFNMDVKNYKPLTTEDISTLLGYRNLFLFQLEYLKYDLSEIDDIKESWTNAAAIISDEDEFEEFERNLDNNPLFLSDSRYDYPDIDNSKELQKTIDIFNKEISKFPGSSALMQSKLDFIDLYYEDYKTEQSYMVYEYFDTAIDLCNIVQNIGTNEEHELNFYHLFGLQSELSYKYYYNKYEPFREMVALLSRSDKNKLILKLKTLSTEKPNQKNLNILLTSIKNGYYED